MPGAGGKVFLLSTVRIDRNSSWNFLIGNFPCVADDIWLAIAFWCLRLLDLTCFFTCIRCHILWKKFKSLLKLVDRSHFIYSLPGLNWGRLHLSRKGKNSSIPRSPASRVVHSSIIIHYCIARCKEMWAVLNCLHGSPSPSVRISVAVCEGGCQCAFPVCVFVYVHLFLCAMRVYLLMLESKILQRIIVLGKITDKVVLPRHYSLLRGISINQHEIVIFQ